MREMALFLIFIVAMFLLFKYVPSNKPDLYHDWWDYAHKEKQGMINE